MKTPTKSSSIRNARRILTGSIAAACAVALISGHSARAASATWNGLTDATWADTTGNWSNTPNPVPGTGDTATFDNAGNANVVIDLGAGVTINTIVFDTLSAAGYTIGSGAVNSQTLTLNNGGALTMNAAVAANQLFNAALVLGDDATAASYALTNSSGTNSLTMAGTITGGSTGVAGAKTLNLNGAGAINLNGVIGDGGATSLALAIANTGITTLSATNTFTGGTTVSAGTLVLGHATDTLANAGAVTISGGTLDLGANTDTVGAVTLTSGSITSSTGVLTGTSFAVESGTISAILAGGGAALTKTTGGTVTLSGANTFTGQLTVQNGTLSIATINNAGTDGTLGNNSLAVILGNTGAQTGTLSYTGGNASSSKKFTTATGGTGAFDVTTGATNLTLSGVIDGSGAMTKTGAGTLTLTGTNTFTGQLTVQNGTLAIGAINNASVTGTLGNSALSVILGGSGAQTGTLSYTGGSASSSKKFTTATGGTGAFDVTTGATNLTLSGVIDGSGAMTKTGLGTLTLTGTNTFSGQLTVQNGTLAIGAINNASANGTLGNSALSVILGGSGAQTGTLSYTGATATSTKPFTMATGGSGVFQVTTAATNLTLSGAINGGGDLTKAGGGTLTLSSANSYNGGTTVSAGKLIMTAPSNLGSGGLSVGSNTFIYAPTTAGALNIGSWTQTGGAIGAAVGGTVSQSAIISAGAATLSGTGTVNIYGIPGVATTTGTHNLLTATSGLSAGTYTLGTVFNNTNFTASSFTRTPGAISVTVTAATALSGNVLWKGGLTGNTGVWSATNGSTQSNWQVTDGVNQPLAPGATADLVFSASAPVTMAGMTLGANMTVRTITINNTATAFGLLADGNTLTITPSSPSTGITKNPGTQAATIAAPVVLGASQTWTNNSTTSLTPQAGINNGGFLLTIDGSGPVVMNTTANVISGSGGLTKNGSGILTLGGAGTNPAHTYTGTTTISGGTLMVYNIGTTGVPSGNLTINGGVLVDYFGNGGSFTRALGSGVGQVQITGGASGFAGAGATSTTFNIANSGVTLVWGSTFFNPSVFVLQAAAGINTNGKMSLTNGINLSGTDRTIASLAATDGAATSGATIAGVISNSTGTAGFTKTGVGNLILTNANTYNGGTAINGGSITLSGNGTINSTASLGLSGGGTLRLINTAQLERVANGAAVTSNGGTISFENTASASVSYTETIGTLGLASGQANLVLLNDQTLAGIQTLTIGTGGITRTGATNTSAITFSAGGTGLNGTKNIIVATGATATTANQIIGPWATTGTTAALQSDYAIYNGSAQVVPRGVAASGESTWTTLANAYTASAGLGGSTGLTATRNFNALRSISPANAVTATVAGSIISLASHTFLNGDPVIFGGTTAPTGLTAGTTYFVVGAAAGTFQVAATSGGAAIAFSTTGTAVTATGALLVSTGKNLGTLGILNGVANTMTIAATGTGAVTLPTTTADKLYVTTGSGIIINNAPITDNTGALTLVKSGSGGSFTNTANISTTGTLVLNGVNTYTGDTSINAGTLQVGTNNVANGAQLGSGSYSGNIFIGAGALLYVSTNANQTLSGTISGDGALMKSNIGTLTLSGNNTYTGRTTIQPVQTNGAGILVVSSLNSVVGGTASSSLGAPTTVANGTIDLGGPNTIQGLATLRYTGAGETTDRVVNISYGSNTTRTLDASGAGLLRFTSLFTSTNTAGGTIELTGTGSGQIDQGLPFAVVNLTKNGGGTWTLGGAVGSTGTFTLSGATAGSRLNINHSQALGTGTFTISGGNNATIGNTSGADITIIGNPAQTWTNDFAVVATNSLNMGMGAVSMGGTRGIVVSGAGSFTVGGVISGLTFGINKSGAGTMVLSGANAYTGATTITAGTLVATNALALGTNAAGTFVTSGATLDVQASIVSEAIDVGGAGVGGSGALITSTGTGTVGGTVTLTGATSIGGAGTLNINGTVTAGANTLTTLGTGVTNFGTTSTLTSVASLAVVDGTTNVNKPLGTAGNAVVSVSDTAGGVATKLRFGSVSQTLSSLTIGAGSTVVFTSGTASGAFSGGGGKSAALGGGSAVVPEPGTLGLLLVGALGMLNRRRRA